MSTKTSIEWTDVTWNPLRGCSLVSAGCQNCYAMKTAHRFSRKGMSYEGLTEIGPHGPRWNGKVKTIHELLDEPLHWKTPRRVFVNSMSDLFHEDVPDDFLEDVWARMCIADHHTYQILTKRPQRMFDWLIGQDWDRVGMIVAKTSPMAAHRALARKRAGFKMFEHVWLGVSVEDQATADERIPILLDTPAAIRFISAEPLLGQIGLHGYGKNTRLNWVIVGGESGPRARPSDVQWFRVIAAQCMAAGVPVFVKQLGKECKELCSAGYPIEQTGIRIPLKDKKGGDMAEWPEDLRVREFPR